MQSLENNVVEWVIPLRAYLYPGKDLGILRTCPVVSWHRYIVASALKRYAEQFCLFWPVAYSS